MTAAAVGTSSRTSTAGRAGVAGWTGPLRRSAWTVALVTALGAVLGLAARGAPRPSLRRPRHGRAGLERRHDGRAPGARPGRGRPDRVRAGPGRGGHGCWTCPWPGCDRSTAAVVGDGSTVELRSSARNPGRAETVAATAVAVAVGLQSSQGSLVSPLPAFHAGAIDGSASATGPAGCRSRWRGVRSRWRSPWPGCTSSPTPTAGRRTPAPGPPTDDRPRPGPERRGPPTAATRAARRGCSTSAPATSAEGPTAACGTWWRRCPRPSTTWWWAATRGPRSQNLRRRSVRSRWSRPSCAA